MYFNVVINCVILSTELSAGIGHALLLPHSGVSIRLGPVRRMLIGVKGMQVVYPCTGSNIMTYPQSRAVIDTARIAESTKKPYRLSISKKAQHIDSYAN